MPGARNGGQLSLMRSQVDLTHLLKTPFIHRREIKVTHLILSYHIIHTQECDEG